MALQGNRKLSLELFSVSSHNEDYQGWMNHFTLGEEYLHMKDNNIVLISDRKVCIGAAIDEVLPDTDQLNCVKHLKDNLKVLGKATKTDLINFDVMIYSRTAASFEEAEKKFENEAKDFTKQ